MATKFFFSISLFSLILLFKLIPLSWAVTLPPIIIENTSKENNIWDYQDYNEFYLSSEELIRS